MIEERMTIGLVVERRQLESAWAEAHGTTYAWRPAAVFAVPPDVAPWTPLGSSPSGTRYYAGAYDISLFSTETSNYRDNLETERPRLWVVLRPEGAEPPVEIATVTADPAEGEAQTEAGTSTVETIDMPLEIAAEIARFIAAHHVDRPILKRKRDRAGYDERWRPGEGPPQHDNPRRNRSGGDT